MKESSCGSASPSAYGVVGVPDSGHPNSCIIVAHCNLHFREIPGAPWTFPVPMSSLDLIHANSKLENLLRSFFQELLISCSLWCLFAILQATQLSLIFRSPTRLLEYAGFFQWFELSETETSPLDSPWKVSPLVYGLFFPSPGRSWELGVFSWSVVLSWGKRWS